MRNIEHYVVIGSSRGLGAALVDKILQNKNSLIIGVSRSRFEDLEKFSDWSASNRYRHIQADIGSPTGISVLRDYCVNLPQKPLCVIFNAALVHTDVDKDGSINYATFAAINNVGVDGLGNILTVFANHLVLHGGVFVGISSFSAFVPTIFEPMIAYPASKTYLDMILRSLRILWHKKIDVVLIHLGRIGEKNRKIYPLWLVPSYSMTAERIIRELSKSRIPQEINYPLIYNIVYRYVVRIIPDVVYYRLFSLLRRLFGGGKGGP